mgnify:CR=1 FL=1
MSELILPLEQQVPERELCEELRDAGFPQGHRDGMVPGHAGHADRRWPIAGDEGEGGRNDEG